MCCGLKPAPLNIPLCFIILVFWSHWQSYHCATFTMSSLSWASPNFSACIFKSGKRLDESYNLFRDVWICNVVLHLWHLVIFHLNVVCYLLYVAYCIRKTGQTLCYVSYRFFWRELLKLLFFHTAKRPKWSDLKNQLELCHLSSVTVCTFRLSWLILITDAQMSTSEPSAARPETRTARGVSGPAGCWQVSMNLADMRNRSVAAGQPPTSVSPQGDCLQVPADLEGSWDDFPWLLTPSAKSYPKIFGAAGGRPQWDLPFQVSFRWRHQKWRLPVCDTQFTQTTHCLAQPHPWTLPDKPKTSDGGLMCNPHFDDCTSVNGGYFQFNSGLNFIVSITIQIVSNVPSVSFFLRSLLLLPRPLHLAARNGLATVVQALLSRGATVLAVDEEGEALLNSVIDMLPS